MARSTHRLSLRILYSVGLLSFAALTLIVGFIEWWQNRPPTIVEAFPSGVMVVGVDATYPPFAAYAGESLFGIDIELADALANRMGVDVRFVPMGFDGLYDALIDGQVDVLISALLVNPARTQDVRYTQPYFDNGLRLVSDGDTPILTMRDLPDQSVALEYGSIAFSEANQWLQRIEGFSIRPYELPRYALDAVRLDQADSALVDNTTYQLYRADYPAWQSNAHNVTSAPYAIAIRVDREATWVWVNATLGGLQRDGVLDTIIDRQFNNP